MKVYLLWDVQYWNGGEWVLKCVYKDEDKARRFAKSRGYEVTEDEAIE